MKASLLFACAATGLAAIAAAACAASEETPAAGGSPDAGPNDNVVSDAGPAPDTDANVEPPPPPPTCSTAGWCATKLPDPDLAMRKIWPLAKHAFAIAESPTVGVKVLEWSDEAGVWRYIDDNTQNAIGFGAYTGDIWAPDENEVYFGVAPGAIYHGKRPAPPETAWSWTRHLLKDNSHPDVVDPEDGYPTHYRTNTRHGALGIWGTSKSDVYAWFTNTIYHWTTGDSGTPEWVAESIATDATDATEHVFFVDATGSGPDDVWFSGARSRTRTECAILVHKTSTGYERIADGVLSGPNSACTERAGTLLIGRGWLTSLQSLADKRLIGLHGGSTPMEVREASGVYSVASAPGVPFEVATGVLTSLWRSEDALWLTGSSRVVRGADVWDGGTYEISSISLSGGPLGRVMYQVRGTSNTNLWAIGARYALHKTTP